MVSPQGVHIGFGLRAALVAVNEAVREVESIGEACFGFCTSLHGINVEALDTRQLVYWDQGHSGAATRRLQAIDHDAVKAKGSGARQLLVVNIS
jgi:hypothetical protein